MTNPIKTLSVADLAALIVRNEDGSPNVSATEQKFSDQLVSYLLAEEETDTKIAAAVSGIFDAHKGKRLPVPALLSMTCQALGATFADFKTVSDKVGAYVRRNAGDHAGATFHIGKGKVGGVVRIADLPPAAVAAELASSTEILTPTINRL